MIVVSWAGPPGRGPAGGQRVLAFPVRIEGGAFATVEQGGSRDAVSLARAIVAIGLRERALAPDFGVMDRIGQGVSASEVVAAVVLCEPDLQVVEVSVSQRGDRQAVNVSVAWQSEED